MEPFTRRLPSERPAMSSEPPLARVVPLPLVPSELLIHLGQRLNHYLGGSPNEPWTPFAVWHDDEIAEPRCRLTTFAIPGEQSPEEGRRFSASRARRHQIGKSRRLFPGHARSLRDHL